MAIEISRTGYSPSWWRQAVAYVICRAASILGGACGITEYFALDVFLRDPDDRVFLTYETRARGVEALGNVWTFLDLTPFGRQEVWEDTPPGRSPQTPPYSWWRKHDEYGT